jgi:HSP20 family protein
MIDFKALVPWRGGSKALATSVREHYPDPFVAFRREVDRMFDDFFSGTVPRDAHSVWSGITPAVDVSETDKEVVVTVELPGVSDKDIEVSLAGELLTIKGEKRSHHEEKNGDSAYMERRFGSFSRSLRLPFDAGEEKVEAQFNNGVLTIRVPKPAELQRPVRRIEVRRA